MTEYRLFKGKLRYAMNRNKARYLQDLVDEVNNDPFYNLFSKIEDSEIETISRLVSHVTL